MILHCLSASESDLVLRKALFLCSSQYNLLTFLTQGRAGFVRAGRLFFGVFLSIYCAFVCVNSYCLPVLQRGLQSELFMRDLNTCKWFTPLSWHISRLPMATAPSRSIFPPLLLPLLSGTHPPTMLSTQWYCLDCCNTRLGGWTLWGGRISLNSQSRSYRQQRMRDGGWTDGRRTGSLHPVARTWSSGDDTQQLVKKRSGFSWWMMLSPMRRTGHTLTYYSDLVTAHAHYNQCSKTGWAWKKWLPLNAA